jgi:ABC-type Fe3+-citrate transport system substrate-binding protein
MSNDLKKVLIALVDESEFLRAHSLYVGTLLSRLGIQVSPVEVQDGVSLAKQVNLQSYVELRKQIEAL